MTETGGPKVGVMNIGEEAKPPFAVLPDASSLFQVRARRLAALAPKHELEPYLKFLDAIAQAQHEIGPDLPPPLLPPRAQIDRALAHGMPPLHRALYEPDAAAMAAIDGLLARLAGVGAPA